MNPTTPMPATHSPATLYILLDAVRCWAAARRRHRPAMAQLHLRLRRYGCEQLDTSKNRRIMSNWAQEEAAAGG